MNEMLKALYDSFYEKLPATQLKAEIERCHQELIEKLDKPERRLYCKSSTVKTRLPRTCPSTASSLVSALRGS